MGMFNDGELKPYPASAYSSLPDPYRWEVPVGIWGPVGLEYIGPIAVDWMRLNSQFEAGDGRLEVEARLRNLDGRQMEGQVELVVSPSIPLPRAGAQIQREQRVLDAPGAQGQGEGVLRLKREFRIAGGGDQPMSLRLALPGARKWEPWRFGGQALYRAEM